MCVRLSAFTSFGISSYIIVVQLRRDAVYSQSLPIDPEEPDCLFIHAWVAPLSKGALKSREITGAKHMILKYISFMGRCVLDMISSHPNLLAVIESSVNQPGHRSAGPHF